MQLCCIYTKSIYICALGKQNLMQRFFFIFSFFVISISSAFAQNSIHGIITDGSLSGIASVSVYIPDLKRGTVTDSTGHYRLEGLPKGKILIEFKCASWYLQCNNIYNSN